MTDDDRMDRAERIKRMREGRREDASTDDQAAETDEPPSADTEPSVADPAAAEDTGEAGGEAPTGDGPDASTPAEDTGELPDAADVDATALEAAKRVAESVNSVDATAVAGADAVETDADPETVEPESSERATGRAGDAATDETIRTRVLEFQLGDERYCLDIAFVDEIVKDEAITRVPNTPAIVEGVVDLRGQITTILDPTEVIDVEGGDGDSLIVVFDAEAVEDQGAIGWLVDAVHQVGPVAESDLRGSPIDEPYIEGVIDRDDQFVLWIRPDLALEAIED